MNVITVKGIKSFAYHGCLPQETLIGGDYLTDLIVETDFKEASLTDDLTKTINYVLLNRIVEEEMAIASKLIEHVAHRILVRIKELPVVNKVEVEGKKINPPINGNISYVSVIIKD